MNGQTDRRAAGARRLQPHGGNPFPDRVSLSIFYDTRTRRREARGMRGVDGGMNRGVDLSGASEALAPERSLVFPISQSVG